MIDKDCLSSLIFGIVCYEQSLLFPQCFQKACFPGASKGVIVWEWVNVLFSNVFNLVKSKILLLLLIQTR